MTTDRTGRIVWHDLFSSDRPRSMDFYRQVLGWQYKTEHATDFAWGGGEKDFVLALLDGEAGAGFVEIPPSLANGWIAYVEVGDVDAAAALAAELGGTIVRHPFDVPGVGRNALLRDPLGALIGLALSRHDFPVPRRQFGVDVYFSEAADFPAEFYSRLFEWTVSTRPVGEGEGTPIVGPSGEQVALHMTGMPQGGGTVWIPSLRTDNVDRALGDAEKLDAKAFNDLLSEPAQQRYSLVRDPDGVPICLSKA